jgi:hypothetical protein
MRNALIFSLLISTAAWAQPYAGSIYGVYPEGVLINQGANSFLLPSQYATFQMNGVQIQYGQLLPGQNVQVMVPQPYMQQVVRVPDCYQWETKHHPNHPHGGPPGQMKKQGNGKGKHH